MKHFHLNIGVYKVPYSLIPYLLFLIKSAMRKNKTYERGKQYNLLYNIDAIGRISSGEKGKGTEILGKKIKIKKKKSWEEEL